MISDVSPEVRRLIYLVVKGMIEKTKRNLKTSIRFSQVYMEACKMDTNNKYDYSNLEMRQHIRSIIIKFSYLIPMMQKMYLLRKKQLINMNRFPKTNGNCYYLICKYRMTVYGRPHLWFD